MMQTMQSQVPQELSALMALQQGMQTGQVAPVTSEGMPTVAGQMAQAAQQQMMPPQMPQRMPQGMPGMADVAQQAGIAAQIQGMERQKMQQALMDAAKQAAQQQQPQMLAASGVAGLHSNIQGFAPGGIVGYAGDDDSVAVDPGSTGGGADSFIDRLPEGAGLRKIIEFLKRRAEGVERYQEKERKITEMPRERMLETIAENTPTVPIPDIKIAEERALGKETSQNRPVTNTGNIPIPRVGLGSLPAARRDEMGPPEPAVGERQFAEAFNALRRAKERSVSPEQVGTEATGMSDAERRFLISQGLNPNLLKEAGEGVTRRAEERGGYYTQQAQDALERQQRRSLATYLMGARGSRLGETLAAGAGAANRAEELALAQSQRFMELKFQVQDAAAKDKLLLDRARDETARGQFDKARKTLEEREKTRQTQERAEAELRMNYGKYLQEDERRREERLLKEQEIQMRGRGDELQYLASIQRSGASGANDPRRIYDTINDNVQKRMDAWSKTFEGMRSTKDPAAMANKRREFLRDALTEAAALGANIPPEVVETLSKGATTSAAPGVNPSQWGELKTR